jgi:hypothetical protein
MEAIDLLTNNKPALNRYCTVPVRSTAGVVTGKWSVMALAIHVHGMLTLTRLPELPID